MARVGLLGLLDGLRRGNAGGPEAFDLAADFADRGHSSSLAAATEWTLAEGLRPSARLPAD